MRDDMTAPAPADLSDLSLADLVELAEMLDALAKAGNLFLMQTARQPRFDLTPGQDITMTIGARMPGAAGFFEVEEAAPEDGQAPYVWSPGAGVQPVGGAPQDRPEMRPETGMEHIARDMQEGRFPERSERQMVPVQSIPADAPVPDPLPEAPQAESRAPVAAAAPGKASPGGERQPAGAPVPGSASALAAVALPWTPEEEERALLAYAGARRLRCTKGEATRAAAEAVGRPYDGVKFRLNNKLAARVEVIEQAWRLETAELVASEPAPPAAEDGRDELDRHLDWVAAEPDDWLLMELTCQGFSPDHVAIELGRTAREVRARFDQLTGLPKGAAPGTKRRFTREAVRDRLQARLDPKPAAA